MARTEDANETLVAEAFEALNDRDRERFVEVHRPNAVAHVGDRDIEGVDAIAEAEFRFFDAFPDLRLTVEELFASGGMVAARWLISGTHRGEFMGIDPTDRSIEYSALGMFRVEDGAVSEVWLEADTVGLLRQLDAIEPPFA